MQSSPIHVRLGRAIRDRRKSLGLKQTDVCALAGVGPAFLYSLEHGKPSVRLDKLTAVLSVLGLGLELGERSGVLEVDPRLEAER